MRHGDKINNLGRTASHRRAMLANMTISLIEHKRITTTLAKAKALRRYAEPLITKSKDNSTHSRRVVFSYLQNKEALTELFGPVAAKIADRPGGYLRIIKLGFRRGDGAETAMIEFVDFNETYNPNAGKTKTAKKTRRGGKKAVEAVAAPAVVDAPAEVIEEVEEVAAAPVAAVEEPVIAQVEEAAAPVVEDAVEVAEEAAPVAEAAAEEVVAEATEEAPAADETPAAEEEEKKD
ncbi:MAG: 50S ribosomal protein L17 [Saprospiraceae bacterium]|nr:50S ribosomal protein L17 [Saprospiraceae bacterium]